MIRHRIIFKRKRTYEPQRNTKIQKERETEINQSIGTKRKIKDSHNNQDFEPSNSGSHEEDNENIIDLEKHLNPPKTFEDLQAKQFASSHNFSLEEERKIL